MWQGINRRRFPRADYPCEVAVFLKGGKEEFSTHTENIGQGGICVILQKSLDRFCPVELILYLHDKHLPIECDGRVVWVVKREAEFDTGIEFINIKDQDLLRIERIVQECLKANPNSSDHPQV